MSTPSIYSALQKLRALLTREEKIKCLGMAAFALCTSLLEVVTASLIVIFAQVLNQPESGQKYLRMIGLGDNLTPGHIVFDMAIIVGIVYFIKNLIAAAEVFYQNFSIQKMNYQFKSKLLQRYAAVDYEFYFTRNSSLGIEVIGSDTELMFSSGMLSMAIVLSESLIFILLISMIIYLHPSLAFTVFGISSLFGFILSRWMLPQFYQFGQRFQEAALYSRQNLMQFFHAFKEVLLLGKRDAFISAFDYHSFKKSRTQAIQTTVNALPRMVIEVMFVGLFVATIAILCLEHESPIKMIGILGGYLYAGFRLMPGLNRIISQTSIYKSVIPSIERVYSEYHSVAEKESYVHAADFHFEHHICLNGVSFRYLNTKADILSSVSLDIRKGECIGIIGETGSGKSTLVDLILGLLKPHTGSILVDNRYPVNCRQWHEHIGYVPQSIYLTDDTIEANIAFGEQNIDEKRLNIAIDAAQLRGFMDALPKGAKTIVGERGIRLSGGERQRIAIARALYRNPEVLIFDEATSALDNETETQLMDTIHAVSQNRTVIMIAHRLTTLKNCDRIIRVSKKGLHVVRSR